MRGANSSVPGSNVRDVVLVGDGGRMVEVRATTPIVNKRVKREARGSRDPRELPWETRSQWISTDGYRRNIRELEATGSLEKGS